MRAFIRLNYWYLMLSKTKCLRYPPFSSHSNSHHLKLKTYHSFHTCNIATISNGLSWLQADYRLSFHTATVTRILHTISRLIHAKCCFSHTLLKNHLQSSLSKDSKHKLFYLDVTTIYKLFPSFSTKFICWDSSTNTSGSPSHCLVKSHDHWKLHSFVHDIHFL